MNEVCPNCGDFVDRLGELTGWCQHCDSIMGITESKPCKSCHRVKPLGDYHAHPRTLDGHRGVCKDCTTAQRRQWREANREREQETWRRYYARRKARLSDLRTPISTLGT